MSKFKPKHKNAKIKLLMYADSPTCATGFGTVSRNILDILYKTGKYDITVFGINYWGDPHSFPYKIYPAGINSQHDPYGRQKFVDNCTSFEFDLIFFLQDLFMLDFVPSLLVKLKNTSKIFKSIVYYPVDGTPKAEWFKNIKDIDYKIAYTEYGLNETMKVAPWLGTVDVIPHGVNTNDFKPLNQSVITKFRQSYFGKHADKFIIGTVARNQPRKEIYRTISAFTEFKKKVPNSLLYLHMAKVDQGGNLEETLKTFGLAINEDVVFPNKFSANQGYPLDALNMIYNSVDLIVSSSCGEGWGLCLSQESVIPTSKGPRYLKDITLSDKVLSRLGTYEQVSALMASHKKDIVYNVSSALSNIPTVSSEQHGFMVNEPSDGEPYTWFQAKSLIEGNLLVYPVDIKLDSTLTAISVPDILCRLRLTKNFLASVSEKIIIDNEFLTLLGVFLDYSRKPTFKKKCCSLTFFTEDNDLMDTIVETSTKLFPDTIVTKNISSNFTRVKFNSALFTTFINELLNYDNHQIHPLFYLFTDEQLVTILKYAFMFSVSNEESILSVKIKNKLDAFSFRDWLFRIGVVSCINACKSHYKVQIVPEFNTRFFALIDGTQSSIVRSHIENSLGIIMTDQYVLHPVTKVVRKHGKLDLIDIQVEGSNSFVADNSVVHNSWIESMAVKTPVLMPNHTAMAENITEDKGYLIDAGTNKSLYSIKNNDLEVLRPMVDIDDMIDKMFYIYNNYAEAMSKANVAYDWVVKYMDWKKSISNKWLSVFTTAYKSLTVNDVVDDSNVIDTTII